MSNSPSNGIHMQSGTPTQIVEIIGLAGTGKSTLAQALCLENQLFSMGSYLDVRNVSHLPYLLKHTLLQLPTYARIALRGRTFTRREVAKTAYLAGWHRVLQTSLANDSRIILLDQGPIYDMATLYAFGPKELRHPREATWWNRIYDRWSHTLNQVIWLTAPIDVLIRRINNRTQWHPVKGSSGQDMEHYLLRYQSAFEHIVDQMVAVRAINVFQLDTGRQTKAEVLTQVRQAIQSSQISPRQKGMPQPEHSRWAT